MALEMHNSVPMPPMPFTNYPFPIMKSVQNEKNSPLVMAPEIDNSLQTEIDTLCETEKNSPDMSDLFKMTNDGGPFDD